MGIACRALITTAATVALAAAALAQPPEEGRGRDISFRGPVFALSRDRDENIVQVTVRVNESQIDVQVTGWTELIQGRGFRSNRNDIALGDFIQVGGFFTSTGRIVARRIHVENRDELELEGSVELISGNLLRIGGIDFLIDADSLLRSAGSRTRAEISGLAPGLPARVRGSRDGGFWRVRELEYGQRSVESEPLRFEGIIRRIEGDLVSVDVGIPEVFALVAVPYDTPLTGARELRTGLLVEVEGRFLPGTALVRAERIAVDGNHNQNVFDDVDENGQADAIEIEGRVRDLRGGDDGNALQFRINETVIHLNAQTELRWRHGGTAVARDLEEGLPVRVEGRRLQDRSVLAIRIELRPREEEAPEEGVSTDDGSGGNSDDDSDGDESDDPGDDDSGDDAEKPETGAGGEARITGSIERLVRQSDNSVTLIVVDGTTVHLSGQTTILNLVVSPGPVSSVSLNVGQEVVIIGVWRNDGSLRATTIEIVKN
jgi:hypothetical protein